MGRGPEAVPFLESMGLHARESPPISSSCLSASTCPFFYYLTRRLGLRKRLHRSVALSRGSWFHACMESADGLGVVADGLFNRLLSLRRAELGAECASQGITGDGLRAVLDAEQRHATATRAWLEAAMHVPIRPGLTPLSYFQDAKWVSLGREIPVCHQDDMVPGATLVGRLDGLIYNQQTGALWILDYKTCSEPPKVRLSTCPVDFQTRHYLYIVSSLLENGHLSLLLEKHGVPQTARLGGMIHVAFQKPTIDFGMKDRPFTLDTTPFKSGPRKGQPRNERVYAGEPSYPLYLQRCRDWYLSRGEYAHLAPERAASTSDPKTGPPVNISHTPLDALDLSTMIEYTSQLTHLRELATRSPVPHHFPRCSDKMNAHGSINPLSPFYLTNPSQWPSICAQEGIVPDFRYPEISPSTPSFIGEPHEVPT